MLPYGLFDFRRTRCSVSTGQPVHFHRTVQVMEALSGTAPVGHLRRGDALLASLLRRGADQTLADALFGEARDGWPAYVAVPKPVGIAAAAHAAAERWASACRSGGAPSPTMEVTLSQPPLAAAAADVATPGKGAVRYDGVVEIHYHWPRLLMEPSVAPVVARAIEAFAVDGDRRSLRAAINRAATPVMDEANRRMEAILAERQAGSAAGACIIVRRYEDFGLVSHNGAVIDTAEDLLPEALPGGYALVEADVRRLEAIAPWLSVSGGPAG